MRVPDQLTRQRVIGGVSSFVRQVGNFLLSAGRWTRGTLRFFYRSTRRQARIQAAKVEIRRLQSRQLDTYAEMGRIVYQMFGEDRVRTERLRRLCEQVRQWAEDVAALEAQIAQWQVESDTSNSRSSVGE